MKLPIGRLGSLIPDRARTTESEPHPKPPAARPPDGADVPEAEAVSHFLHHPPNGDAGPSRDDFRNVFRPDFFTKQLGLLSLPV